MRTNLRRFTARACVKISNRKKHISRHSLLIARQRRQLYLALTARLWLITLYQNESSDCEPRIRLILAKLLAMHMYTLFCDCCDSTVDTLAKVISLAAVSGCIGCVGYDAAASFAAGTFNACVSRVHHRTVPIDGGVRRCIRSV